MPRWGNWSDPVDLKSAAVKHPGSSPGRGTYSYFLVVLKKKGACSQWCG